MTLLRKHPDELAEKEIGILGIPLDENSSFLRGPAKAPPLIVQAIASRSANSFTEDLTDLDRHSRVFWCGNASFEHYPDIAIPVGRILDRGAIPFLLGGDHSITYPALKAFAGLYPDLSILHFDAHSDLYDELDGNRYSHACPFARVMEDGLARSITQVGVRTLTQHQREQVERFHVTIMDMKSWSPEHIFDIKGPVYVSFDLDVLDPAFAPGVSHHEPGGFSTREVLRIIQNLNLDIVGIDLVEYNPDRDINGVTAMVAAKIVKEFLALLLR